MNENEKECSLVFYLSFFLEQSRVEKSRSRSRSRLYITKYQEIPYLSMY